MPFFSTPTLTKVGQKLVEISKTETVPNIQIALLKALREVQQIHQDGRLDEQIRDVYKRLAKS